MGDGRPARRSFPVPGALFTDLYELTMLYGYFRAGLARRRAAFELFFRQAPFGNGWALAAGLEQVVHYLLDLRFLPDDLDYLRGTGLFPDPAFLAALAELRFTGDLDAVPEGSVVFPREPLLRLEAPLFEAQLAETALLNLLGHQTLLATKASRLVRAARGKPVLEFGARRAHGVDAAVLGARAAIVGGCTSTSDVLVGRAFGAPLAGTMAHSWIQSFPSELDAFRAYAEVYPENLVLLVDTYDVRESGLPNAIRVFREVSERRGRPRALGVRIDSGDLASLCREARRRLDEAGFRDARVVASGDLDERAIADLEARGAAIDVYGVGTHLITAGGQPALGCVYKLAALEGSDGAWEPRFKRSEDPGKVTDPGRKQVLRYYDGAGTAAADVVTLVDEPPPAPPAELTDLARPQVRVRLARGEAAALLRPVLRGGRPVADVPGLAAAAAAARASLATLPEACLRLRAPRAYPVALSPGLARLRADVRHGSGPQ